MGLDYIRNTRGKPWRKQWAQGLNLMNEPTLFDIAFRPERTVLAHIDVENPPVTGAELLLELMGGEALVFDGQRRVAKLDDPPEDVLAMLNRTDNIALATVVRIGIFGDEMELSLK